MTTLRNDHAKTRNLLTLALLAGAAAPLPPAAAQTPLWTRQFGAPLFEYGSGVAVDGAGNAYISGTTEGSLGGPSAGGLDAFLARYDASGTPLWSRPFGTSADDESSGMAVDGAGNAYITGSTLGSLGGPSAGGWDVFLAKYDASGAPLWTRQFGTSSNEYCTGVAVDSAGRGAILGTTASYGVSPPRGPDTLLRRPSMAFLAGWFQMREGHPDS